MTDSAREIPHGREAESARRRLRPMVRAAVAWGHRIQFERKLAAGFFLAAITAGVLTFFAFTDNLPFTVEHWWLLSLLVLDLILLLGLSVLIVRRLVIVWVERKKGLAGSRLHTRLVGLFSLVAALPTIVVAVFSAILFDFGLRVWFSDNVSTAIRNSLEVAEAYLDEHGQTITADALAMAQDLNRGGPTLLYSPQRLTQFMTRQAAVRALTEAAVIDREGNTLAQAQLPFGLGVILAPPDWALDRADNGETVVITSEVDGRVQATVRLESYFDAYLVVSRFIDPQVIGHLDQTRGAYQLYTELEGDRNDLQITFAAIFVVVSMLLLLAAVWVGLLFANRLSKPIRNLIATADRVRAGDLTARVQEQASADEIGHLSRAFNRMTAQIANQQSALLDANRELETRRRFTEAVLSGITPGVVGLDHKGRVTIANPAACRLLGVPEEELIGEVLGPRVPNLEELLERALLRPSRLTAQQIKLQQSDGSQRTLLVRVTTEAADGRIRGFVVTFDDITELLSAQRKAAWADVARRIAHEIKNPLTPIQLAAERLRRRYLHEIESDPETFQVCTDTIVRHVSDIGRMVDEFSAFARMPTPSFADVDLSQVLREALFLQQTARPGIQYDLQLPKKPVVLSCDSRQVSQAVTNLLQNAAEAIEGRDEKQAAKQPGRIRLHLKPEKEACIIQIEDNGRGLPKMPRDRLTEPYVTTREKGTGLGLAIVKKIMEDHRGDLLLEDREGGGALVRLILPYNREGTESGEPPSDEEAKSASRRKEKSIKLAHGA